VFSTTADGASSPTERMRIANNGAISTVVPGGSTLYPAYDCRAWVNFNGTGTVAIRASGNVSSITDNGTGDYTVNFTTAMPDANFVITTSASELGSTGIADWYVTAGRATNYSDLYSTTLCKVEAVSGGGSNVDPGVVNVAIFR